MKKIIFTIFISIIGINFVLAESNVAHIQNAYGSNDIYYNIYHNYSSTIDYLINYYNTNLSQNYSYYIITATDTKIYLIPCDNNYMYDYYANNNDSVNVVFSKAGDSGGNHALSISYDGSNFQYDIRHIYSSYYIPYATNFNFSFQGFDPDTTIQFTTDLLKIDSYQNYPEINLYIGDVIPTYVSMIEETYNTYIDIDLNSYEYVLLSLNSYDNICSAENQYSCINTEIITLGRLCLTPVYNYGMTQRQDVLGTDLQVQACTNSYSTFTPVSVGISNTDIENHVVFYVKAYDNNVNKIKVDSSKFNVSYITSQNVNNPTILIEGRTYPVIPYNDLTDTAKKSSDEGYIAGQTCALGDVNCQYRTIGLDISDLWTQPLKVLQSVWSSITAVFSVITEFILLIPSPLREFLISAFFLSVILGIIKIIV